MDLGKTVVLSFGEVLCLEADPWQHTESVFCSDGAGVSGYDCDEMFLAVADSETSDADGVDGEILFVFCFLEDGIFEVSGDSFV